MSDLGKEIVVTGVNGFVGEHLSRALKEKGFVVRGIGREPVPGENVADYLDFYQQADLFDKPSVEKIVLKDAVAIIHLAGLASVAESFNKPDLYKTGNAEMTGNLLSAAVSQGFKGRAVIISTGALYDPHQPMPLAETSPTVENSPYATGKLRTEAVTKEYITKGLDAVIVRPFNHIGAHQGPGFLLSDLYDQLAAARDSGSGAISTGDLTTKRDYTNVQDTVQAYIALATAPTLQHDTYNVASGKSLSGKEILDALQVAMGLTNITTSVDPARIRPNDIKDIVGDTTRITNELGWTPQSTPAQAVVDFVNGRG